MKLIRSLVVPSYLVVPLLIYVRKHENAYLLDLIFIFFFFTDTASQIVNDILKNNVIEHHVQFLRKELSARLNAGLWDPIQKYLIPLGCSVSFKPKGGYFIWLTLPFNTKKLTKIIKENDLQVGVGDGELFNVKKPAECDIRLSFSHYDIHTLQEAIERLRKAISIGLV